LVAGNIRTGERREVARRTELRAPKGLRFNHRAFPTCRIRVLDRRGPAGCPRASRIGSGTSIVDARPLLPDFVRVSRVLVFNARTPQGRPALAGWVKVFGFSLITVADVLPPGEGFGPGFAITLGSRPSSEEALFTFTAFELRFPKLSRTLNGKRVNLFDAPKSCRGSWVVQAVRTEYSGERQVATNSMPCVKAGRSRLSPAAHR
jgi:hypothetical protein